MHHPMFHIACHHHHHHHHHHLLSIKLRISNSYAMNYFFDHRHVHTGQVNPHVKLFVVDVPTTSSLITTTTTTSTATTTTAISSAEVDIAVKRNDTNTANDSDASGDASDSVLIDGVDCMKGTIKYVALNILESAQNHPLFTTIASLKASTSSSSSSSEEEAHKIDDDSSRDIDYYIGSKN